MSKQQVERPRRWANLAVGDERKLLLLAGISGDVGHTALGALTHLQLRVGSWIQLRSLLLAEVKVTHDLERRRFLLHALTWMPVFEPDDVVAGGLEQQEHDASARVIRTDLDLAWIRAPAPGFLFVEVDVRKANVDKGAHRLQALADRIEARAFWLQSDPEPPIAELNPLAVTALFELSASDSRSRFGFGNALVKQIAKKRHFCPDLDGLFSVYRRTVSRYAVLERRSIGPWLLDGRDNEHPQCWLSWQLAWTASRGGIVDLVVGMIPRLSSTNTEEQIAALLFIADAADYCVQREPELFGGGRMPPRLGRDDSLRVMAEHPPKQLTRKPPTAPAPMRPPMPPAGEPVDAAVFCPPRVAFGSVFMVQVFLWPPQQAGTVGAEAQRNDPGAERLGNYALPLDVPPGTRIDLHLEMPTLTVDEPDAVLVWRGRVTTAQFEVAVPALTTALDAIGRVRFAVAGVPAGTLRFLVTLAPASTLAGRRTFPAAQAVRYRRAFVSYSSQDRAEVLRRVQAFKIAGMSVFQDILDLDPGERWEKELYRQIDGCDVFLLFWSKAAAASPWVGKEIDYAIARKKGDPEHPPIIQPVPIEGPPIEPPPPELSALHFNDALLAQIAAASPTALGSASLDRQISASAMREKL